MKFDFKKLEKEHVNMHNKEKLFQLFIVKKEISKKYKGIFDSFNKKVKQANDSQISDSLLFSNGLNVVGNPMKKFVYKTKMREAVFGEERQDGHNTGEKTIGKYYKCENGYLKKFVGEKWKNRHKPIADES